jgi:hypothetical protein
VLDFFCHDLFCWLGRRGGACSLFGVVSPPQRGIQTTVLHLSELLAESAILTPEVRAEVAVAFRQVVPGSQLLAQGAGQHAAQADEGSGGVQNSIPPTACVATVQNLHHLAVGDARIPGRNTTVVKVVGAVEQASGPLRRRSNHLLRIPHRRPHPCFRLLIFNHSHPAPHQLLPICLHTT